MKKLLMLGLFLCTATAHAAQERTIKMAGFVNPEVEIRRDKASAKNFNIYNIQEASALDIELVVVKGQYPNKKTLAAACKQGVEERLKAPGSAKWVRVNTPYYLDAGGVYIVSGDVDAQNSYGALIRNTFFCEMAYSGDQKAGLLYVLADVFSKR